MDDPAIVATSISGSNPVPDALAIEREDPDRCVLKLVAPASDRLAASRFHPSYPDQASPDIDLRRRFPPITCTSCGVTHLRSVGLPASSRAEDWICPLCLRRSVLLAESVAEARREVGEIEATERPPEP